MFPKWHAGYAIAQFSYLTENKSNTKFCLAVHTRQMPIENHARDVDGRKQIREKTYDQGDRESLHRTRTEKK